MGNNRFYLGFDNGVSSNGLAVISSSGEVRFEKLPIKKENSYTKEKKKITRIDVVRLRAILKSWNLPKDNTIVLMERPLVNPRRFTASMSAMRALEASLIVFEEFGLSVTYIDSKKWQSVMLPNVKGSEDLKQASLELGQKLFPQLSIKKDADSLLIAEWARRNQL